MAHGFCGSALGQAFVFHRGASYTKHANKHGTMGKGKATYEFGDFPEVYMVITPTPPLSTIVGKSPPPEKEISKVLPTDMLQKVIHETVKLMEIESPGSSWKQISTFMQLNKRLNRETISYLEHQSVVDSDRGDEYVDRLLCLLMRKYYEAGKNCSLDEYFSQPAGSPHKWLLELVRTKLKKSPSIRMGLAHSRELKDPSKLRAPAYWPTGGINPHHTYDFLCLIKERTDLKRVQVGVKYHGQRSHEYDLPAVKYDQDPLLQSSMENLHQIVATLAKIRKNNPNCDVSLSIDWGESHLKMMANMITRMWFQSQFLEAWKKHPGITTLNIIGGNTSLLLNEMAENAKNDEQIRMLRFHCYHESMEGDAVTASLCNAMQGTQEPMSIAFHFHPGSERSIMFTVEQVKDMITSFANSKNTQSLLLEVHEDRMREVLASLNNCDVQERLPFHLLAPQKNNDELMRARKEFLAAVKTLFEDGLEEFRKNREIEFEFEVRHIDIKSERDKQKAGIWNVSSDFEILLTKKKDEKTIDRAAM